MTILENKTVKCRKKHYCAYCGDVIESGESAYTWNVVDSGDFFKGYAHHECQSVVDEFDVYEGEEEIADGYLEDTLNDFFSENQMFIDTETYEKWATASTRERCEIVLKILAEQKELLKQFNWISVKDQNEVPEINENVVVSYDKKLFKFAKCISISASHVWFKEDNGRMFVARFWSHIPEHLNIKKYESIAAAER